LIASKIFTLSKKGENLKNNLKYGKMNKFIKDKWIWNIVEK